MKALILELTGGADGASGAFILAVGTDRQMQAARDRAGMNLANDGNTSTAGTIHGKLKIATVPDGTLPFILQPSTIDGYTIDA